MYPGEEATERSPLWRVSPGDMLLVNGAQGRHVQETKRGRVGVTHA